MAQRSDGRPEIPFPWVTGALIAINVFVWFVLQVPNLEGSVTGGAFYPCAVNGTCDGSDAGLLSWFTAMFMHASSSHLAGNMIYLAVFGKDVEAAFGHVRYLALYIVGGFAATALQTFVTLTFSSAADAQVPMLGASGAISAILGAFLALYPHARIRTWVAIFPVDVPAWIYLGVWFGYQLTEAQASMTADDGGGGVAFYAHIGGFIFGWFAARRLIDKREVEVRTL